MNKTISQQSIYHFTDFRAFMIAHYEIRKRANPRWTVSAWAKKLGLKATASLTMVLHGQRLPGPNMIEGFLRYFDFKNEKEKKYFLDLIRLEKTARDPDLRQYIITKLNREHPQRKFKRLDAERFSVISSWQHYAIREMTRLKDFSEDPEWIKKRLRFRVSLREVSASIKRLTDLSLIFRNPEGKLESTRETLDTSSDVSDMGIRLFHEGMILNALESLKNDSVSEREITGLTVTLRKDAIPIAKEKIRIFVKEMSELLESETGDSTYQMNIQFFPLTKIQNETQTRDT